MVTAGPWTNCSSCLRTNLMENLRSLFVCLLTAACTVWTSVCACECMSMYELHHAEIVRFFFLVLVFWVFLG